MLKQAAAVFALTTSLGATAFAAGTDFYAVDLPPSNVTQTFVDLVNDGHAIKKVALRGDQGWVILFDHNGWVASNVQPQLAAKLEELGNSDKEIKSVAFTKDGGFGVLFGHHDFYGQGLGRIPTSLIEQEASYELKDLVFPADGGLLLLEANGGYAWDGLAVGSLPETLRELAAAGTNVDHVFTTPDGGFAIFEQGKLIAAERLPQWLGDKLNELQVNGISPLSVSFAGSERWMLVW